MANKKRGIAAERELLHKLWKEGFAVARVAGSGSVPEPSCDLLAGNHKAKYAIEVKSCRKEKKYLKKDQMQEFIDFSERFGLEPIIAIKFIRKGWYFIKPKDLEKTNKGLAISLERAKQKNMRIIK